MFRFIQIAILSLCLSTSSFSLNGYLTEQLKTNKYNQKQLHLALSIGNVSAKYISFKDSVQGGTQWLSLARFLARNDQNIAWQLALYYQQKQLNREQLYWANHAYQLGAEPAIIDRAKQLATTIENYPQAKELLKAIENEESHLLQVTLAVKYADFSHLQTLIPKLTSSKEQALLNALLAYQVLPSFTNESNVSSQPKSTVSCRNSIQFFASNLSDLNRLNALFSKVRDNNFFNQQFCFETPKYIEQENLNCSHQSNERINCDVQLLVERGLSDNVKYIGVMAPQGVANVDNGVVSIDHFDSYSVLEHELLHLIGFIDEYPLNKFNTACERQGAIATNIVNLKQSIYSSEQDARAKVMHLLPWKDLIKASTPISHKTPEGRRLGTPDEFSDVVGLFVANTCQNYQPTGFNLETFKPVKVVTQLQYFEEPLPLTYQRLAKQMNGRFDMPSYTKRYYNIGKKYNLKGDVTLAHYWFVKAEGHATSAK